MGFYTSRLAMLGINCYHLMWKYITLNEYGLNKVKQLSDYRLEERKK